MITEGEVEHAEGMAGTNSEDMDEEIGGSEEVTIIRSLDTKNILGISPKSSTVQKKDKTKAGDGPESFMIRIKQGELQLEGKKRPSRENEVYDYFLNDIAKSKQRSEPFTPQEWQSMIEARQEFMKVAYMPKIFE